MANDARRFLHDIGLELTEKDLKSLKFLNKDTMGDAVSEKICDGLDFLDWLEKEGKVNENDMSVLAEYLDGAKRTDLADKIRKFQAARPHPCPRNAPSGRESEQLL